jgi:DNA-binding transcriptional MerR regulator/methylmalonyl-CoA mutase cobalamin-binding subunit
LFGHSVDIMFTIKQAARLTGVSESSLRAWERRYSVVTPRRTEAGYRLYDEAAIAALATMRRLVESGWSPSEAASSVRSGTVPQSFEAAGQHARAGAEQPVPVAQLQRFLAAAAAMDSAGIEASLDQGFALGSFEHVVEAWLFPTLEALGEGWAQGEISVAGEHAASHAVHRRLSAAYDAAGRHVTKASVLVGLPPGSTHELGALAFATAARRRGLSVLYLGADVPVASWEAAAASQGSDVAVLSVVTASDRGPAAEVAERLLALSPRLQVAGGGTHGADLGTGVHSLPFGLGEAALQVEQMVQSAGRSTVSD